MNAPAIAVIGDGKMGRTVAEMVQQNDAYLLCALVFGTLTTVLGGYVTARLAQQLPLLNALALGLLGICIGVLLGNPGQSPLWFDALGFLFVIPAAIFGGVLGRRARKAPL